MIIMRDFKQVLIFIPKNKVKHVKDGRENIIYLHYLQDCKQTPVLFHIFKTNFTHSVIIFTP